MIYLKYFHWHVINIKINEISFFCCFVLMPILQNPVCFAHFSIRLATFQSGLSYYISQIIILGVPIVAQCLMNLTSIHVDAGSIDPWPHLRIRRCPELWCGLQMQLRSGVAVAVAWAGRYSSNSTPSLRTDNMPWVALERQKTKKKIVIVLPMG